MTASSRASRRPVTRESGMTLLEVMAAVVIVGLVHVVFFQAGGELLGREGENRRRIEATLLADRTLAELESALDRGLVPAPGVEAETVGDFAIEIETEATTLTLPEPERGSPYAGALPDPNSLLGSDARPEAGST